MYTDKEKSRQLDKLAAAANFWVGLTTKEALGMPSAGQAAAMGGGALLAGGTGALLHHLQNRPQVGGLSRAQVDAQRMQGVAADHAANEGQPPPEPGAWDQGVQAHADWAAKNPGLSAGVAAAPWAVAGAAGGYSLHNLYQELLAAKAAVP